MRCSVRRIARAAGARSRPTGNSGIAFEFSKNVIFEELQGHLRRYSWRKEAYHPAMCALPTSSSRGNQPSLLEPGRASRKFAGRRPERVDVA